MKYIDADKLIAKIQPYYEVAKCNAHYAAETGTSSDCTKWDKAKAIYEHILRMISSLQQEQPEVDLEKEIDACWKNWLSPSNQKEVEGVLPKTEFAMYARYFWNKGYNARKEEIK